MIMCQVIFIALNVANLFANVHNARLAKDT